VNNRKINISSALHQQQLTQSSTTTTRCLVLHITCQHVLLGSSHKSLESDDDVVYMHQSSDKLTKYTASCSTSKKRPENWHQLPLSPHNFCDHSPQRPTNNSTAHSRCSYLARPWCAVYHTWWHDIGCMGFLNGMMAGQFHSTQHWTPSKEMT